MQFGLHLREILTISSLFTGGIYFFYTGVNGPTAR